MEQQRLTTSITIMVLAVAASLFAGATAQSSSSCTNVLLSLSPCLSYISGNSSTPSSGCCKQLATVVQSQPHCLCQVLNGGGSSLGITINQTQAMALPSTCNVKTPSISQCTTAASPTGSTEAPSTVPSRSSGKSVPTTSEGSSDGGARKMSVPVLLSLLFVASCGSAFVLV